LTAVSTQSRSQRRHRRRRPHARGPEVA
jgi:hypothetical protein